MLQLLSAVVTVLDEMSSKGLRIWFGDGEWHWFWEEYHGPDELIGSSFGLGSALRDALLARVSREFR